MFGGEVYRTVKARDLWTRYCAPPMTMLSPAWIFIDRINALNKT